MRITRLELDNIKSYRKASLTFPEGITAICGPNGAGKTTVLEAIGFTLFSFSPYTQDQFLREGEKSGSITVTFVSNLDEREYQAVRRIGSSPGHFVYDPELRFRVAEQATDVKAWLKDHLGLDGLVDLANLFSKAVGVPQGLVTAHFLDTPAERHNHFDPILRVEEYGIARDRLRETVGRVRDLLISTAARVENLEQEVARRPQLEEERRTLLRELEEAGRLLERLEKERLQMEERWTNLEGQHRELERRRQEHIHLASQVDGLRRQWDRARQELSKARKAREAVEASIAGHQAYLTAQENLERLERDRRTRDKLRDRERQAEADLRLVQQSLESLENQLAGIGEAEVRLIELQPLVKRQEDLGRQREAAQQAQQSLQHARERIAGAQEQIQQRQGDLLELDRKIEAIEVQRPTAERQPLLEEREIGLRRQIESLRQQGERLAGLLKDQREIQARLAKSEAELAGLERLISSLRAQAETATRLPSLESRKTALASRLATAASKLHEYQTNREYAADGRCPLLHEQCLNVGEGLSLAEYFDGLIRQVSAEHATLEAQLRRVEQDLEAARKAEASVATLAVREQRLQQVKEEASLLRERLEELSAEIQRLEAGQAALAPAEAELLGVQADLRSARQAAMQVAQLETLRKQREALERDLIEHREALARAEADELTLRNSPRQLAQISQELLALGDPRSDLLANQRVTSQRPEVEAAKAAKEGELTRLQSRKAELAESLVEFARLDEDLKTQRAQLTASQEAHQNYLVNRALSETVEDRAAEEASLSVEIEAVAQNLAELESSLRALEQDFDQTAYDQVRARRQEINREIGEARADQRNYLKRVREREDELARLDETAELLRQEKERKRQLEELGALVEIIRNTIRDAGPMVTKQLLQSISLQANGIFGQILGDYGMELSWHEDYGITVRQGVNERSFAQLSGGEQMTAALSVRLALLKELSEIDVAFFDEPTQNMDEDRRTNLAQQITQVKGFSQLFVISHDDTFEQYTGNIIHVRKEGGESLIGEDGESDG